MTLVRICFLFIAIIYCTSATQAFATCTPTLNASSAAPTAHYDPFSGATIIDVNFTLSNSGTSACTLSVQALSNTGDAQLIGPDDLDFIPVNTSDWDTSSFGATLATLNITLPANTSNQSYILPLRILPEQVVPAGNYQQEIKLILNADLASGDTEISNTNIGISAVVQPRVQAKMSFSDGSYASGGSVTLFDLGVLRSGLTDRLFLKLRGTADALVTISSENSGQMVNQFDRSLTPIGYQVEIKGNRTDLSAPLTITESLPATLSGKSIPMRFTIGDVSSSMAGTYKDTITVDVTAF